MDGAVRRVRPASGKPFLPVGIRWIRAWPRNSRQRQPGCTRIEGRIDADTIRFAMPEEGVLITDGTLKLSLDDDRVRVQQGELKAAADASW